MKKIINNIYIKNNFFIFFTLLILVFVFSFPLPASAICCKCENLAVVNGQTATSTKCENVNVLECKEINESFGTQGAYTEKKCTFIDCSDPLCPPGLAEVEPTAIRQEIKETRPILNIWIGGVKIKLDPVGCPPGEVCPVSWIGQYINILYRYIIGLAAILAGVMILFGGFIWLTSFGSPEKVKQAKDYITGAFTGLLLALFSYFILSTINPDLVNFNPINVGVVKPLVAGGFGTGAKNEGTGTSSAGNSIGSGAGNGSGTVSNTGLTDYAVQKISEYEAHGCVVTDRWRADGAGSRHQSGYVADFGLSEACEAYIIENAEETKGAGGWWHAYYVMPDGSVWVNENNAVTGGSGPHFHVEFADPEGNWEWREAR